MVYMAHVLEVVGDALRALRLDLLADIHGLVIDDHIDTDLLQQLALFGTACMYACMYVCMCVCTCM